MRIVVQFLAAIMLCANAVHGQSMLTAHGSAKQATHKAGSGGGGCTSSYRAAPNVGTGDRTAFMTVTFSKTTSGHVHSLLIADGSSLIDGTNGSGGNFFDIVAVDGSDGSSGPYWIQFDLGSSKVLTKAKYYQQSPTGQGTWKWQGSNDGSNDGTGSGSWTDIGGSFSLATSATTTLTTLSANTTSYRYYRILGVSGSTSNGPFIYEFEFQNCQ